MKNQASELITLKKRLDKIKTNKKMGRIDHLLKICKNCQKEYNERENYNWSCRTHQSEYGGDMWWCCGKKNKEDPGCKYGKHVTQEDADEDEK